jgi:hypothetical protein
LTAELSIFNDAVASASAQVNTYLRQLEAAQKRLLTQDEALSVFYDNAQLALTAMEGLRVILRAKESGLERLQVALGAGEGGSRKRQRAEIDDDGDQAPKRRETEERPRDDLARSEFPKRTTNTGKGKEPVSSTAGFLESLSRGVAKANPKSSIDGFLEALAEPKKRGPGRPRKSTADGFLEALAEPKKRGPGRPRKSTAVELPPGSTSSSTGRKNSRSGPEPPKKPRSPIRIGPFIIQSPTPSEDEK